MRRRAAAVEKLAGVEALVKDVDEAAEYLELGAEEGDESVIADADTQAKALEDRLRAAPWFWLMVAGFVLMVAGLVTLAMIEGHDPNTTYQPPRYEGGQVVPGEFK